MANSPVTQYGNVLLIDPNLVNVNTQMINSIPQYQDMYIFAELTAKRRGRTVLETTSEGITTIQENGTNNDITVNFMGNNQDPDNRANYLNFTTNWYDGSSAENKQFEGFGITNIKVVINSSYVPQVNIEFTDIRGLAFFNQNNSPFKILFDFPPPIFNLTLKGYYGMQLTYKLHLVKYTSEFRSENGNYVISAQFVALTFAPLSDVLFRYIVNFPLMPMANNTDTSINPDSGLPPKNTYELILKLKNLYTQYSEKKNTDVDTQEYKNTLQNLSNYDEAMSVLSQYKSNEGLKQIGIPQLVVRNGSYVADGGKELTVLSNLADYNGYIKEIPTEGQPNNISQRLMIVYLISNAMTIPTSGLTGNAYQDTNIRRNKAIQVLSTYRQNELLNRSTDKLGNFITDSDIPLPNINGFFSNQNIASITPEISNLYVGLDVTNFYVKLYKEKTVQLKLKADAMDIMNEKINNMVIENLGMKPTIYNIFKLILDDVDTFFRVLRTIACDAENHHKTYIDKIVKGSGYKDTENKIFAFPLVVKDEKVCNQIKQSRTAPIELSYNLDAEFPELKLIREFIETFTKQQTITALLNMKAEQNADGTFKWIPISPVDSKLASINLETPYYGVDNSGGGSTSQPINLSTEPKLKQVFRKLITRFYILSQNSFAKGFYSTEKGQRELVNMFSQSESINLAASITNKEYANLLLTAAKHYGTEGKIEDFYAYVKDNIPDLYSFSEAEQPFFKISNGGINVYTNKKNSQYEGFSMYNEGISLQTSGGDNNPIDDFQKNVKRTKWKEFWNGKVLESLYGFTQENVFLIKDSSPSGSGINSEGTNSQSRFIAKQGTIKIIPATPESNYADYEIKFYNATNNQLQYAQPATALLSQFFGTNTTKINRKEFIDFTISKNLGNTAFPLVGANAIPEVEKLEMFGDISETWISQLSEHDTEILAEIISGYTDPSKPAEYNPKFNPRLSALVLASNFGTTLSPFNVYPHFLSKYIFNDPAVVEVPSFLPFYVGALVDVISGTTEYNSIYNFFISGSGRNLNSGGAFVFADIVDINEGLAEKDKALFKIEFERFYGSNGQLGKPFSNIILQLKTLYAGAQSASKNATSESERIKLKAKYYETMLNASNGKAFNVVLQPLLVNLDTSAKNNIINYNQLTFLPWTNTEIGYESIGTVNTGAINDVKKYVDKKAVNNNYFKGLFEKLAIDIQAQQTKIANKEEENKKLTGDEDIITQTYYSFKNINDKWLVSPNKNNKNLGYPLDISENLTATNNRTLIDAFVFVDRAMNPIGNTIINPEILIDLMDNPDVSVFSVLSQILSMNGFEFFPLQNFMKFENNGWEESFKIDTRMNITSSPAFVCMYLGGSSSYPTGIGNMGGNFVDDGILEISTPGVPDFSLQGCEAIPTDDNQTAKNPEFPYREVRAFRVRFGEQNQSMFKDIKIDSKEYPETNESLQILSRIAGDNKLQAPPPKGQNLYSLYENRSYRATIIGLGNMMIQPTQYFQLENIPLFNGAYIILGVEHNIEPNKMTTSFSGTKILKYPVPRVLQSSSIVGFDGGNSGDTNPAIASADEVTIGVGALGNPPLSQFNSLYTFKIQ